MTFDELLAAARALEVADVVSISYKRGGKAHLALDAPVENARSRVEDLLASSGYHVEEPVPRPVSAERRAEALVDLDSEAIAKLMSIQAAVFLLLGFGLRWFRALARSDTPRLGLPLALGVGALAGAAILPLVELLAQASRLIGFEVQEQAWIEELLADRNRVLVLIPWLALLGPWSEEVFFRGYVLPRIRAQYGLSMGLFASALLFAAIHNNFSAFHIYFAIGWVLGFIHHRSGRLIVPIVAHMTMNLLILVWRIWPP